MKASWEKIEEEKNKGVLHVEVDEEQVQNALDLAFNKVVKNVNVSGFRKGKVPRKVFESRFGVEVLYNDALDFILPTAYEEAVKFTGIKPVDRPEIDVEQFEKDKPLIFKANVTVKTEVKLGEYIGVEIAKKDFVVLDEDIDKEIESLQKRHADVIVVEDGVVEQEDTAVIDFEGFLDSVPFEGGKATMHPLEIGSGSFIPGFEEQLIGMSKDEEKEILVTFPEEYNNEELAGKEVTFKIILHEIKRKQVPELNDEFAKDVDFETLDELKEDTKKRLEEKVKQEKENYYKEEVVRIVTENATVDIPEIMIENETDRMIKDFDQQLNHQGMNLEIYLQYSGIEEDDLKEQFKKDAYIRVKSDLVLESITEKENVEASEEEVEAEIKRISELYNRDLEEIRNILCSNEDGIEKVKDDIKFRKTIDFLVDQSK